MITAGILLLAAAFLCLLSIMLKSLPKNKLTYPLILFQGSLSVLLILWACCYLFIFVFFETELTIHNLGIILFLSLLFSYTIILTVAVLLSLASIQKLFGFFRKREDTTYAYEEWYSKLVTIHIPLALLCFIIGVWDIIYITSLHSLLIDMMESSPM